MTAEPAPEPRDGPNLLVLKCAACRAWVRAQRRGFSGARPARRCPTGRCRTVWAEGYGPGSGTGEVDPEPPSGAGPV